MVKPRAVPLRCLRPRAPSLLLAVSGMVAASALSLSLVGCGGDDSGDSGDNGDTQPADDGGSNRIDANPNLPDAATAACTPTSGTNLGLVQVASGLDMPLFVTSPPGDPRLFVVEKGGRIKIISGGQVLAEPFLDLQDRVNWSMSEDGERGLLGLAFHPDYATTGRFFVYYTAKDSETAGNGADVIAQFYVADDDPNRGNPDSELRMLEVPDYASNHNGGMMAFGPDGHLYVGLGDGGSRDDPFDNGQNKETYLGDFVRLDVDSDTPYGIPDGNPYKDSNGDEKKEIWLSGVRNPWRWSFDRKTGDLYIADVGQGTTEEVTVIPAGEGAGFNLGWDEVEGDECFEDPPNGDFPDGSDPNTGGDCTLANYTPPTHTYGRDLGSSITGGYVYRGSCAPDLDGWYFFGDWGSGRVFKFIYSGGVATEVTEVTDDLDPEDVLHGIASFGQDSTGELYIVSLRGGTIHRIVVE